MGMLTLRPGFESYAPTDEIDQIPVKADSAALIYPVITLEKPYTHTSVHKIFAGARASSAAEAEWSVQNYITPSAPAFFLFRQRMILFQIQLIPLLCFRAVRQNMCP